MPRGFEHNMPRGFEHNMPRGFEHTMPRGFEHNMPRGFEHNMARGFERNTAGGLKRRMPGGLARNVAEDRRALLEGVLGQHRARDLGLPWSEAGSPACWRGPDSGRRSKRPGGPS
jgi:hypothetical protein